MSKSNSEARKLYWSTQTREQRTARARKMLESRYSKMTPEQRSEHARKIVQVRWAKYKLSTSSQ